MTEAQRTGILICHDLMFMSKVSATARHLGLAIQTVGNTADAIKQVQQCHVACLILDLSLQSLNPQDLFNLLPTDSRPATIAFGSHVDVERLQAARQAGCQEVFPRSQFNAQMDAILQRYLGEKV